MENKSISLTNEQLEIARFVKSRIESKQQVLAFVTGRAGSGKSVLIRYIVKIVKVNVVVCAFTNRTIIIIINSIIDAFI